MPNEKIPPFVEMARQWFTDNNCRMLRADDMPKEDRHYEYYNVGGVLVVLAYAPGWCELLRPVINSIGVQETLDALAELLDRQPGDPLPKRQRCAMCGGEGCGACAGRGWYEDGGP